jgi:hypothetical protein
MSLSVSDLDWTKLSPEARETLEEIAVPNSEGATYDELAERLDITVDVVKARLGQLAGEARVLADKIELPKLSSEEYASLRASIEKHGQFVPIIRDVETGAIIDGNHRLRACRDIGIEPRYEDVSTDSADERRSLAFVVNVARRQLTPSARRGLVEAELVKDPSRSDRSIAGSLGVSPTTVGTVRGELEKAGLSKLDTRRDKHGTQRPAAQPAREKPAPDESLGFHTAAGLYFKRVKGGDVRITICHNSRPGSAIKDVFTLTPETWASVVASVSARDEDGVSFAEALNFHQEPA